MPWGMSAAVKAELAKASGFDLVWLLDLQLLNGTLLYWTDYAGTYPVVLGAGPTAVYSAWIKSIGEFTFSRTLFSDGGSVTVQNVSGNTIERDVSKKIRASEFSGALAVLRGWAPLAADIAFEFHASLAPPSVRETEVVLQLRQLGDPNQGQVPKEVSSETCTLVYKGPRCGSTGTAPACTFDYAACADATRAAVERFNGFPSPAAVDARDFNDDLIRTVLTRKGLGRGSLFVRPRGFTG
jgi:hypothetical protein